MNSFITFTLRKETCTKVTVNNTPISIGSEVKYLGLILDKKLTWNPCRKYKRKVLNARLQLFRPLLRSKMNINNKLIIYKFLLRPLQTYGNQLWGAAKPSTTQAFQSICLHLISSAPWYVTNNLHKDRKIQNFDTISKIFCSIFYKKIPITYKSTNI